MGRNLATDRIKSGNILGGSWVLPKIVKNGLDYEIGIANQCSYNEDFRVQGAEVIGFLGPIAYDSLGYSCQITMGIFVPRKGATTAGGDSLEDLIREFLPTRSDIINKGYLEEVDIQFFDIKDTTDVLHEFRGCVLATNSLQINPNQYAVANLSFFSVERAK